MSSIYYWLTGLALVNRIIIRLTALVYAGLVGCHSGVAGVVLA